MHPAALPDDELLRACTVTRGRRGGPGGQHRNKVETAVRIVHDESGVVAEAAERRSQRDNLAVAVFRLRMKLAVAVRQPWKTPSDLWRTRTQSGKLAVNAEHDDAPALLAESLDAVATHGWDDKATAEALGVSRSQLLKFWRQHPAALERVNAEREGAGMFRLR